MKNLPYDYSRCFGGTCPIRESCARYTSPGRPEGWQSINDFSSLVKDRECPEHISNRP